MKVITVVMLTLSLSKSFAMEFSFRDLVRVPTVTSLNVVPSNLAELYPAGPKKVERMIAGRFETKYPSQSYRDGLRQKLRGSQGFFRF